MEFIIANWWWISFFIPGILIGLKVGAKLTKWDGDDKIVTLLAGLWDIYKGRKPRTSTGKPKKVKEPKPKPKKYSEGGDTPE